MLSEKGSASLDSSYGHRFREYSGRPEKEGAGSWKLVTYKKKEVPNACESPIPTCGFRHNEG
jgi:hypothetical protein